MMSESTTYKNDVFVSYSEVDREWVQNELLPRLYTAGLKVIEQSDFELGAPKLINAAQAVNNSRHTLIIITPAWLDSEWAKSDWLLTSSQDPDARQRRLIPLRLLPCELPASIGMLTIADFTDPATQEAEMKRLLRGLGAKAEALADDQFITALSHSLTSPDHPKSVNRLHRLAQPVYTWLDKLSFRQRILVYGVIGVLIMASVTLVWLALPEPLCPSSKTCVLVAQFSPEGDKVATDFSVQMISNIRTELDKTETKDFAVRRAPVMHTPDEARALARQVNALLIVWGQVFTEPGEAKPLVTLYFQLTDLLGVGEAQGTQPYRAEPLFYDPIGEHCSNCVHLDATQRADVVVQAVAGLVHYAQGQPEMARLGFMAALYCAGEPLDKTMVQIIHPTCQPKAPVTGWNPGLLYYYTGKALVLQGDYASAIAFLRQAAAHNDQDPAAWLAIGTAYQSWVHQPDAPDAVKALRQAETLAQNLLGRAPPEAQPMIHYNLGVIDELLQDFPHAQQHYQEAANRFTNAGASAYTSLIGLARVQKRDDAIQTLEQARKLDEKLPWAYLALAQLQHDDPGKAKDLLKTAEASAPNEVYVAITRAELCQQWQEYACAAAAYAQALQQRPDSGWLYSKIGEFYLPTNPVLPHQSWTEAERYFRRAATELRPQDPWAHERLAYVLFNETLYAESVQEYQRTLQLVHDEREVAEMYCSLGRAQQRAHQASEAQRSFERCSTLKTPQ